MGWAQRGGGLARGHGNSVPRFHIAWGTGPGVLEPFIHRVREAQARGLVDFRFRHRVSGLSVTAGAVDGVYGHVLEPSSVPRGRPSSRRVVGEFHFRAQAVIIAAGGIGANHDLVRRYWPERLGPPPGRMLSGVPDHVDGSMLMVAEEAGARLINRDRMWHYTEGIENWDPIWTHHGIRILPGPSSLWVDAYGRRLPPPLFPGFDSLATLAYIRRTGHDHTWFILTLRIIEEEFALCSVFAKLSAQGNWCGLCVSLWLRQWIGLMAHEGCSWRIEDKRWTTKVLAATWKRQGRIWNVSRLPGMSPPIGPTFASTGSIV